MAGPTQQLSGSAVIRSLRRFRDRYFTNACPVVEGDLTDAAAEPHPGFLDSFPVSESHLKVFGFSSKTIQAVLCVHFMNRVKSSYVEFNRVQLIQLFSTLKARKLRLSLCVFSVYLQNRTDKLLT